MMAADIAVARRPFVCAWEPIFEDFEARAGLAPQHPELSDDRSWIDSELYLHPVVRRLKGSNLENERTADNVNEELRRGLDVGHGKPNMIGTSQAGQAPVHRLDAGSLIMVISRNFCSSKT